ncbi:MAG: heavy metal-associated domain-containing protein [Flavobacteriaceae bacterium]|nr:heavy-metal-associated domain-containing protein [Flavobacteriaceae bacterium]
MNTTLAIQNLKCGGCANTITTRLSNIDGIDTVTVNNETDSVSFNYNNENTLNKAVELLSKLGYPVEGEQNPLSKKAKSFVSCAVGRMSK